MNPFDMLKNMGDMQARMREMQEQVRAISVTGTAGAGMVSITMNGEFTVSAVNIAPEAVDPDDMNMLQDLIRAAHNDAVGRVREELQGRLSSMTGGLDLPPGLFGGT